RILRPAFRAAVPIEHAAVAAGAAGLAVASPTTRVVRPVRPRRVLGRHRVTALVTRRFTSTRAVTSLAAAWTHRPAAGRTRKRERKHEKRAIHDSPLRTADHRRTQREDSGSAQVREQSIQPLSAAQPAESNKSIKGVSGQRPEVTFGKLIGMSTCQLEL